MNALSAVIFALALAAANAGLIGLHGGLLLGHAGDGHEGQYIPSGLERLSDDGSYRPEHHLAGHGAVIVGHGLGLGYGLGLAHLAGSGLEGQYIPSGNELHHDDGSYRPEHHLAGHLGLYH